MKTLTRVATLALTSWLATGTAAAAEGQGAPGDPLAPVVEAYVEIATALAADKTDGVAVAAARIEEAARGLTAPAAHEGLPEKVRTAATALKKASGLGAARAALKDLSKPLVAWARAARPAGVYVVHCPMAGASWLQRDKKVRNPYYGSEMLACGEVVSGPTAESKPAAK